MILCGFPASALLQLLTLFTSPPTLPQLRKWIGNLEAMARAQLDNEEASGEPAPVDLAMPEIDGDGAPVPASQLDRLPSTVAAAPPRVEIPPNKQTGFDGLHHPFELPLGEMDISLCAPSPPDSPQYGSSCSSSSCASPSSPKVADFCLTVLPPMHAAASDTTMLDRNVLAWRHHLAVMHQGGVAVAQPSHAGLHLGTTPMAFAVAQPLLLPVAVGSPGRVLPMACVQECADIVDDRCNGRARHADDEERDISDAMLMDALLDDETILEEVSSSSAWVEDWLFDFVNGDR